MKKALLILLVCYCSITTKAQIAAEWFNQKKTQIKYLSKQIAELQIYLGYVKRGYKIVSGGLNTIHDIKNGELNLHDAYYKSLRLVNPQIRNSPKAKAILSQQLYILKTCNALTSRLQSDKMLPGSAKEYIKGTTTRLLDDLEKVRRQLLDITTDNSLELTDNERLERLNTLYNYSKSQVVFVQKFSSEVLTLINALQQEQIDDRVLKELHNLQ